MQHWAKIPNVGKILRVFFLSSHTTATLHFTSDTRRVDFPHIRQFSDTSWVFHNLTQFWYYLLGVNIRSHMLRSQSHKIAYPHFGCWSQVPSGHLYFWLAICKSHVTLLGFDNLLQWLTELRKKLNYLYQLIIKSYDKGYKVTSDGRDA